MSTSSLPTLPPVPLDTHRQDILHHLQHSPVLLLEAPPGTGKSTRVPLWAMEALSGRILLLEPRRLAARMLARYLCTLTGSRLGGSIGLVMRRESLVGPDTRLCVVTEGVFTRMICEDIFLEGVSCVLFDEFHERHLTSDLGLALALHVQRQVREDLRLGVLSATLDSESLGRVMPEAAILRASRPGYPVDVRHLPPKETGTFQDPLARQRGIAAHTARAIEQLIAREAGSVLAFLPGAGEIRRCARLLEGRLPANCQVHSLHASLASEEQRAALAPAPAGTRKIVLSTDIAETSLTIEGIRLVVDSGWQRRPLYDPARDATSLVTRRIPLASALQRQGRAGRLEPGVCLRLWAREAEDSFPEYAREEILHCDLTGLALNLALVQEAPENLPFVTQPPQGAYAQALQTLRSLRLVGEHGITGEGRKVARLGLHPRTGCVLLHSGRHRALAALVCAFLEESARSASAFPADLALALEQLWASGGRAESTDQASFRFREEVLAAAGVLLGRLARVDESNATPIGPKALLRSALADLQDPFVVGRLLVPGYRDKLVRLKGSIGGRSDQSQGNLVSGAGVVAPVPAEAGYVLALDLQFAVEGSGGGLAGGAAGVSGGPAVRARPGEATVTRYARLDGEAVQELFADWRHTARSLEVDDKGCVRLRVRTLLGALVLESREERPTLEECATALCRHLVDKKLAPLFAGRQGEQEALERWLARVALAARTQGAPWPVLDRESLLARQEEWLPAAVQGAERLQEVNSQKVLAALKGLLPWPLPRELDKLCPEQWVSPCGKSHAIDYGGAEPYVSLKLQECLGLQAAPVLGCGVPLTLHLLSPGGIPLAVTRDILFFWREVYPGVRAEMRGRYPRHPWPEDPLHAAPTTLTQKQLRAKSQQDGQK